MFQKHIVRVSTLFLLCFAAVSAAYGIENTPQVDLNFEKGVFGFNEAVPIRVTVSNTGASDAKILRWLTPVDGVRADLFSVTLDGEPVEYMGILAKRAAPTASDYITLKSGETLDYTVNLADYYDLSQGGYYQIAYRAESFDAPAVRRQSVKLKSASVAAWIYGTAKKLPPSASNDNFSIIPNSDYTVSGCTTAQTNTLPGAVGAAKAYAFDAYSYLNAGTQGARYTTWFGAYTATRYNTVRTHFLNIKNLLAGENYVINCSGSQCTSGTFAYVFPTDTATHTIYVCNQFNLAATTGTDSKAGTLIHEMSHFNDIAGTSDFAYGQSAAMSLASSNPNNAVANADNHEYFAEAGSPTAAEVTISGRVVSDKNRAIADTQVTLVSTATGATFTTQTSASGNFLFTGIEAGQTYIISVSAKRFLFEPQLITANENLAEINLVGVSPKAK